MQQTEQGKQPAYLYIILVVLGLGGAGSGGAYISGLTQTEGIQLALDKEQLIRLEEAVNRFEETAKALELHQREIVATINQNTRRIDVHDIALQNQTVINADTSQALDRLVKLNHDTQLQIASLTRNRTVIANAH